jgi:hypothetical protein
MKVQTRTFFRSVVPFTLLAGVMVAGLSCEHESITGTKTVAPAFESFVAHTPVARGRLLHCPQTYDSVTRVIGPRGGTIRVGAHLLWIDSWVLGRQVRITAVASADTLRQVRFEPSGLRFPPNPYHGLPAGALIISSYRGCSVLRGDDLRIAQVDSSLNILGFLQAFSVGRGHPWCDGRSGRCVPGWLPHFSNYAIAWRQ